MRYVPSKLAAAVTALAMLLLPMQTFVAAQTTLPVPSVQHYTVIDLTPPGSVTSTAAGVSGTQQVGSAGFTAATAAGQSVVNHAVVWNGSASRFVDLGVGAALGADAGKQVGNANGHAALWSGTAASLIDLNPAAWTQSVAAGVGGGRQAGSATRDVVCTARRGKCPGGVRIEIHPFTWSGTAASAVDLTPLTLGFGAGRALATDGVQQVGYGLQEIGVNTFNGPFAVLWTGTADSAINLNPPDSGTSQANAVSGGQQVGFGYTPHHALLWKGSAESVVDLHPDGYAVSEANATNGTQQAGSGFVGDFATSVGNTHALVWLGSATSAIDLNQFLPPGFTDAAATGIDAAGNVVGWASVGSPNTPANVHAMLWSPGSAGSSFAQSLALGQSTIVAGDTIVATVTLSQPAPTGGAVVVLTKTITSSSPVAASVNPFTVDMPPSVTVAEGQTVTTFSIVTSVTTTAGFNGAYHVDIQASYGGATPSATLTVNPPLFLSSLSVAPGNLAGGSTAVGTVTLNGPAPAGGALVALASNSAAATMPASVLVPAGQTGATFTVRTGVVTTPTTVTLTATYGSRIAATRTASLSVTPPPAQTDTVAIQKAEYVASKGQLSVQATGTNQTATLTASSTATGQIIGVLTNRGGGKYDGTFNLPTNPQNVTVTSNLNGKASRAVTLK
jgi:hypothetical protein